MKDDSLSDVTGHKPYSKSFVDKINAEYDLQFGSDQAKLDNTVGKQESPLYQKMREVREAMDAVCVSMEKEKQENVYAQQIWNDALETAAKNLAKWYPDNVSTNAFCAAIRSVKK